MQNDLIGIINFTQCLCICDFINTTTAALKFLENFQLIQKNDALSAFANS